MTAAFSWVDRVASASMLAGDQSAGLPVTNLADRIIQKVYRSGNSYSTYFEIDFGAAYPIQVLALFGCTLAGTDTVRHRLSAVSAAGGELLDTGTVACGVDENYGTHGYRLSAEVTARYWRCDIGAASRSALGYFDIGRAWAGEIWEPGINYALGWRQGFMDTADISRARHSGVVFPSEGCLYRRIDLTFDFLTEDEQGIAMTLDRVCGKRAQIGFFPDTSNMASGLVGRMAEVTQFAQPTSAAPARFSKDYRLEQDL